MQLKGKKVLVTGGGGFIASHLVEHLVEIGCQVRALVHYNSQGSSGNLRFVPPAIKQEVEIITGDIADSYSTSQAVAGQQVVFHLAALIAIPYSYKAPQSYINTNVGGSLNVFQACLDREVEKVVHTSTSEVYGTALYEPIDEGHPLQGQSPYSASKIGADMLAQSFHRSFALPIATIRPFNTYGPRQSARAVIPTIISQLLSGKERIQLGSIDPVRDLTFVKDTARGFAKTAELDASIGEVINVGFGKGIAVGDLAEMINRLTGKTAKITVDPSRIRPDRSEVMKLICDNRKATKILNWTPAHTLEDGLLKTIKFVEQNPGFYNPQFYTV